MKENVHENHRERMRDKYITQGADGLDPHELLEIMLYYSIPRSDTNPLAHKLIDTFGSFSGVLDAAPEDLATVEGVGKKTAVLLKLFLDVQRAYKEDQLKNIKRFSRIDEFGEYLLPRFIGRRNEIVVLMCLNSKNEILCTNILFEGSVNSALFDVKKLVSTAIRVNAASVVIAHNHPGGIALPSSKDIETTVQVLQLLNSLGIILRDHIIFANDDFVSMAQSPILERASKDLHQMFLAQSPDFFIEENHDFFEDEPLD